MRFIEIDKCGGVPMGSLIMALHTSGSWNPVQDLRNTKAYMIRRIHKGLRRESGDCIAKNRGFDSRRISTVAQNGKVEWSLDTRNPLARII